MGGHFILRAVWDFLRVHWRTLVAAGLAGGGAYAAVTLSDTQGRFDLPRGYAVRMTCENDPESAIWSGGWHTAAGFLERMHGKLSEELGPDTQFILTGGDGPRLGSMLPGKFTSCPELVLLGLAAVAGEKP